MKLERAASVVGVIGCLMLMGGCAGSRGAGASARPVVTDEGAVASADPIGASLFAGSRGDESPRPMLTSATIEE